MASLSSCPACHAALSLFTPREISRHVNACLDTQGQQLQPNLPVPRCGVCSRDLSELTVAARAEHANRCVDNLNPRRRKKHHPRQTTIATKRPHSPPKLPSEDDRVRRFLELLGLERYAQKFADEEIDFPALRLLEDSDFAQLRIPDAARRRIADALTAVPIIAQIEGGRRSEPVPDAAVLPTQRFGVSRLAGRMQRNKPMVHFDDSDGEYAPTPTVEKTGVDTRPVDQNSSNEQDSEVRKTENVTKEDRSGGSGSSVPNFFEEIERIVQSRNPPPMSASSDVSSFPSDPEDLNEVLRSTSQITIEIKLQKWRRRKLEREKCRHKRELERIETEYTKLMKTTQNREERSDSKVNDSPELSKGPEQNCDTIDLTQDISDEENGHESHSRHVPSARHGGKSIVISSNESMPVVANSGQRDTNGVRRRDESSQLESRIESERRAPIKSGSVPRPQSPCSGKQTPEQDKEETGSEEEVVNLISTEKKRGTKEPLEVALSPARNIIAPLFAPTPNRDELRGTQKNPIDSDEDFMDLLGVGKENTRSSSQPTVGFVRPVEDAHKRSSTECDSSSTQEAAATQSRLKKRPKKGKRVKATSQEIAYLIRSDKALHEEVLMMESVPFDHILSRVRRGEKHVTKKGLYDFLQNEGIMFKGDSVEPGSQQEAYMRRLNSDACPD